MARVWKRIAAVAATAGAVAALAACGSSDSGDGGGAGGTVPTDEKVSLTFWGWDTSTEGAVRAYERAHPNVSIKVVNAGSGIDEYTKFRAAVKAGKGAPDAIMLEYSALSQFALDGSIVDLTEAGVDQAMIDRFAPWYIELLSNGGEGVYGLPLDAGLMAYLYREDLFKRYGLTPPRTWAEFAATAARLKQVAPGASLAPFLIDYDYFNTLAWQNGSRPFEVDGEKIRIAVDNPQAIEVAQFWDRLIADGLVATTAPYNNTWFAGLNRGTNTGLVAAQWLPVLIKDTSSTWGRWRAAPLPQWQEGQNAQVLNGGSAYAVTRQSEHAAVAADVVKFITSDMGVVEDNARRVPYAFYPVRELYESRRWREQDLPFYGPQKANEVFGDASDGVDGSVQASPFQDYVNTQGGELIAEAIKDRTPIADALRKLQPLLVEYAKKQGFTVE